MGLEAEWLPLERIHGMMDRLMELDLESEEAVEIYMEEVAAISL